MPLPSLGSLPSELSPRRGSPAPLGAACSLAVIHRRAETSCASPFAAWFPRRPRSRAVAWFPQGLWTPFPRTEARVPVVLGAAQRNRLVPPASPASKPSSPHRIRSRPRRVAPSRSAVALLGVLAPPELSLPCTSDPRPAWTRRSRHESSSVDSDPRPGGPRSSRPGEAPPSKQVARRNLVGGIQRPSRLARTASRRRLLPSWSWAVGPKPERIGPNDPTPDLQGFEVCRKLRSPRRPHALLGFVASSSASWLRCPRLVLASPRRDSLGARASVSGRSPTPLGPLGTPPDGPRRCRLGLTARNRSARV